MNEIWIEKIENYLNGTMSREDRQKFESELETNEELSLLFTIYRTIETEMHTTEQYREEEALLKKSLEKLNARYFTNEHQQNNRKAEKNGNRQNSAHFNKVRKSPAEPITRVATLKQSDSRVKRMNTWKVIAIAAAFFGVISLSVFIWYSRNNEETAQVAISNKDSNVKLDKTENITTADTLQVTNVFSDDTAASGIITPDNKPLENKNKVKDKTIHTIDAAKRETLFARHFMPDTASASKTNRLQEVLAYYKNQEYDNAIAAINDIDPEAKTRGFEEDRNEIPFYWHYFKALSYMGMDSASRAIPELKNAKSTDSNLQNKALWYLALAYLKTGEVNKTEKTLNKLANNNKAGEYQQKAKSLLSDLTKK
jgi:hypothetical protein